MGNPNTYPRHNSSPYRFDRRYLRLKSRLRMKKNPYVPYFRHSPPTSLRSLEASISEDPRRRTCFSVNPTTATTQPLEISSHIRRLDNAYLKRELIDRCEQLVTILEKLPNSKRKHGSHQSSNRRLEIRKIVVDGHLRGGNRDTLSNICDASTFMNGVQKVLEDSSKESSSSTVKVLAKLGSWFLFPLAYDAASCGYRDYDYDDIKKCTFYPLDVEESDGSLGESSSDSDGDASINEEDDNSVAVSDVRDHQKPSSLDVPFDISVSEIAQAYYAHQVVDQSEYSSSEGHRLDYVITQMDIARMARNASRHLDVDSILNLPTVTFKCPNRVLQQDRASSSDPPTDKAFSFVLVEQHKKDGSDLVPNHDDMCVICLEPYKEGDRLRVLPCDHSFHVGCIDRWLSGSHSHHECFTSGCPTCKTTASQCQEVNDGSVPSWAFAQLGGALARSSSSVSAS